MGVSFKGSIGFVQYVHSEDRGHLSFFLNFDRYRAVGVSRVFSIWQRSNTCISISSMSMVYAILSSNGGPLDKIWYFSFWALQTTKNNINPMLLGDGMKKWNGSDEYSWRYRADTILSTDGQTDKVIPVYPPFNFVEAGGIMIDGYDVRETRMRHILNIQKYVTIHQ